MRLREIGTSLELSTDKEDRSEGLFQDSVTCISGGMLRVRGSGGAGDV